MQLRPSRTFQVEPALPPPLEPLREIAANLYWTWNTEAAELFRQVDPVRWEQSGHNPVRLLQQVPLADLEELAARPGFLQRLAGVDDALSAYVARPLDAGTAAAFDAAPGTVIAYFSLEFALTESLPVYSGGLGVLAGDHLKSASDLGLPLVAVGLLYSEGYFQQTLSPDGWQREDYNDLDFAGQPLERVNGPDGAPIVVTVALEGRDVSAAIWRIDVGRVPLFLLSCDVEGNSPEDREITARLYGGDSERRIQQEILVGIGGVRALQAMGIRPAVCHMNEGHSSLLAVERIRMVMAETGCSFDEARIPVSASTAFTTHTAVAAGIDLFPAELVRRYLAPYYTSLGLDEATFIGFGRTDPANSHEPFSMALLGLRLSGYRNGVSKLHRKVSQSLWESAWPDLPAEQVPIDAITNGVHLPTWVSHELGALYDNYLGEQWREDPTDEALWRRVEEIPAELIWATHERQRHKLVARAREQRRETAARHGLVAEHSETGQVLDPHILTIGFARRFAGYKRATLLFRDPARLARIVNHPDRPVQFIFAGKAHPKDEPAKQLIREVVEHSRRPEFRDRLVILERYDVELARVLVQGCDAWLNTPLRPLEASGTSGMKAVANGSLHISVEDGWWAEAYRPGIGWAVGRDRVDDDPEVQDAFDAESIYDLLEDEVTALFYERDADGLPRRWVERMKGSVAAYAPVFNTNRMVREYAARAYAPAAANWQRLLDGDAKRARTLSAWLATVGAAWGRVAVNGVSDNVTGATSSTVPIRVTAHVQPGGLPCEELRVDVVHGTIGREGELVTRGEVTAELRGRAPDGSCLFEAEFAPEASGRLGYAIRVMPSHPDLPNPFAAGLVRWG